MFERKLGRWINNRKTSAASLTPEQRTQLSTLPGWTWDAYASHWDSHLQQLIAWLDQHEQCYPKQNAQDITEKHLARWVNNQRLQHPSMLDGSAIEIAGATRLVLEDDTRWT